MFLFYAGETDYNALYYDKNGLRVGRVEVCVNGTHGTVCNEQWSDKEASVVCAQLGFSTCGEQSIHGGWILLTLVIPHF